MKVHHLNCATFCPVACQRFFSRSHFVSHVLLVESDDGLILVDTGFGAAECEQRGKRVGRMYAWMMGPAFDRGETALAQVEAMGFSAKDVRHLVVTHLDLDHAGGIPDFPHAQVHVFAEEHAAAMARAAMPEKGRYLPAHWAHGPDWKLHEVEAGEGWHGFEKVRPLPGVAPELLIVPCRGHTRGHAVVAVDDGEGWLVHCGDAYFDRRAITDPAAVPKGVERLERTLAMDDALRVKNVARLRELKASGGERMRLFCAHDPADFPHPSGPSA